MTLFGINTDEKLPDSYFHSHKAWDNYMAHLWYLFLFYIDVKPYDTIIEIGVGNSIKIGKALSKSHFIGNLFLVDPCQDLLKEAGRYYAQLLPNATIELIPLSFIDALPKLPKHAKCLLANHPLDDMLLAWNQTPVVCEQLFTWTAIAHEQTIPLSLEVFNLVAANPQQLQATQHEIAESWLKAWQYLMPNYCIMSQYPSLTLKNHGLDKLNHCATFILNCLQEKFHKLLEPAARIQLLLNANKNYNDAHIGGEVLNAKNWLVVRR